MNKKNAYMNWHIEKDADNIWWLYLDKYGASANTLNDTIFEELEAILDEVREDKNVKGVVFASKKASGFIAGADIEQFTHLKSVEEALVFVRRGQKVFDRVEALHVPTVAMIEGFCLGGGFEFALACRYRVAEDGPKTRIGLPEVLLGIHPGWGGTVRLPRLIGAPKAMDLILSGKALSARDAYKVGMINDSVPKRHLKKAARSYILASASQKKPSFINSMTNAPLIRPLLGKYLNYKLRQKISPLHYPAPFAVVENWIANGVNDESAMITEANSLAKLVVNDTARNLVRAFFLQERLKGLAKGTKFNPTHVHVIGAGTMGGDIAAWCALSGLTVTLQDREPRFIAPAIGRAYKLFKKRLKVPRLVEAAMDRLIPDVEGRGVAKADVVIEAIIENLQAKRDLFASIEPKLKAGALLATNTSSIPLDELSKGLKDPNRLVGIHFFNPVAQMRLVEVVHGEKTDETTFKNAMAFVRKIDRLPLPVKSSPGFLVNRILMPYLTECMVLLEEGVPAALIDKAAMDFGMPMGPVELSDTVGLDVCLSVAENLSKYYGGTIPERLRDLVKNGNLGKKTGKGFYEYKKGKPVKIMPKEVEPTEEITDRLILRMLNEAMACLREKVVTDGDLLDAGMIYGTGFAPFRGGPIHYIHEAGLEKLKGQLQLFEEKYGARFKPDQAWKSRQKHEYTEQTA